MVLFFGLLRPYKGLDVLYDAWRRIDGNDAELWVVGQPWRGAPEPPAGVKTVPRFVSDAEAAWVFRHADLVVLPYRVVEQSGVLLTALAFGKAAVVVGHRRVQRGERRAACRARHAEALATAIHDLLERHRRTRPTRGRCAHRRAHDVLLGRCRAKPRRPLCQAHPPMKWFHWIPAALLAWTHVLYGIALRILPQHPPAEADITPTVSLIIPAFAEESVIADKVANVLALDYPRERLEVVVVCDGSPDRTAQRAKAAGADVVLDVPRAGKVIAQDRGVAASQGEVVAFSDANAFWEPDALRELVRPFAGSGGRLRVRSGPLRRRGRQPRGPVLAVRDADARPRVGLLERDGRQRRDLRGPPQRLSWSSARR